MNEKERIEKELKDKFNDCCTPECIINQKNCKDRKRLNSLLLKEHQAKEELLEGYKKLMQEMCHDCTDDSLRKDEWLECNCEYSKFVKQLITKHTEKDKEE